MKIFLFVILFVCLRADIVDDLIHVLEEARAEEQVASADAVPMQTLMDMVSFEVVGNGFCRDANGAELKLLTRGYKTPANDVSGKNGPCALLCANYAECTGYAAGRFKVSGNWGNSQRWAYSCYAYGNFKHTPPLWTLRGGSILEPAQGGGKGRGDAKCKKIIRHPVRDPIKASCSAGQMVKKMATGDESCVPKGSIDWNTASCKILRPSVNFETFKRYGCQGAAYGDGSASEKYCGYPWYNRCCEWNTLGIRGRTSEAADDICIQKIECNTWPKRNFFNDVAPKVAPEMGPCSWAQWSTGNLNQNYCNGRGGDHKRSWVHPWFQQCCRPGYEDFAGDYGRIMYCIDRGGATGVWPRREGFTYYEH